MAKTQTDLASVRLCQRCMVESDGQWFCGYVNQAASCSRCDSWEAAYVLYPQANDPRLEGGYANPEFTTSLAVTPSRYHRIVWDVNLYYRDLGVSPYATKAELRAAYLAREGSESARLTFVMKQLLNDEVRERYDATPLGAIFFDAEIAAVVRQRIADEVAQTRMVAPDEGQPLVQVDLDHLMNRRFDFLDKHPSSDEDGSGVFRDHPKWGWYRWATPVSDQYRLSRWRTLLAGSFAKRGLLLRLAIGYHNQPESYIVRRIGFRTVIFFRSDLTPDNHTTDQIARLFEDSL